MSLCDEVEDYGSNIMFQRAMYEKVHTITDYYDGPREGIANYNSVPYFFESIWDDVNKNYIDIFILTPVTNEDFNLAMELWRIYLKWRRKYEDGIASEETHPAYSPPETRYNVIQKKLQLTLGRPGKSSLYAKGEFHPTGKYWEPSRKYKRLEVRWYDIQPYNPT